MSEPERTSQADNQSAADEPKHTAEVVSPFAHLGRFKPKAENEQGPVASLPQSAIDQLAEANGFHSRDARPAPAPAPAPAAAAEPAAKPAKKRRRFGAAAPRVQLNIKAPEAEAERFYKMAEDRGIRMLSDLLSIAMDALEERDAKKK